MTLWQKILSVFGLGPKPPLRRADRPGVASTATQDAARPSRSNAPGDAREPREPRESRESREARPPREPRAPRPVIQHEVTSGRLYVGNLSYDVTETDLTELFGGVGQVMSAEIVVNRATQRSKGFAFVEMLNIDQAKRAVAELHDKEYMGRKMLVTGAKAADAPRDEDARAGEGRISEQREPRPVREPREPRSYEPRSSERPPRREFREPREPREPRESRAGGGPVVGDVTTGIIRREQLPEGVVPAAGPVSVAPLPAAAPPAEPAEAAAPEAPSQPEARPQSES